MLVLVTNDDGIDSLATIKLAFSLKDLGYEVILAAPSRDWSGSGKALGSMSSVRIHRKDDINCIDAYSVNAPPAAIVALFIDIMGFDVDVVVSGINYGPNLGFHDILTSGTIGAALEAAFRGVLGVSISSYCFRSDGVCIDYAVNYSKRIIEFMFNLRNIPFNVLSINIPKPPPRGVKFVKPSPILPKLEGIAEPANNGTIVKVKAKNHAEIYKEESDEYDGGALIKGFITMTPIMVGPRGLSIPLEEALNSMNIKELERRIGSIPTNKPL